MASRDVIKLGLNTDQVVLHKDNCWKINIPSGANKTINVSVNLTDRVIPCHIPNNVGIHSIKTSSPTLEKDELKPLAEIILYENNISYPNEAKCIEDICNGVSGYFFVNDTLYFSSSDGTSPINNNYKYHCIIFTESNISDQKFTFGVNWLDYVENVNEEIIKNAGEHIDQWLNSNNELAGKTVIDIGCGSGLSTLCLLRRGVKSLLSFDYDSNCVLATNKLVNKFYPDSTNWNLKQGSVLDDDYIATLGQFDVVYSWGVLHHTGNMLRAVENAIKLVKPGGNLFISLYAGVADYSKIWSMKQLYNLENKSGKINYIADYVMYVRYCNQLRGLNPDNWNMQKTRGMNVYNDIVDWIGGIPYEVTNTARITKFCKKFGLTLVKTDDSIAKACHEWLFVKQ